MRLGAHGLQQGAAGGLPVIRQPGRRGRLDGCGGPVAGLVAGTGLGDEHAEDPLVHLAGFPAAHRHRGRGGVGVGRGAGVVVVVAGSAGTAQHDLGSELLDGCRRRHLQLGDRLLVEVELAGADLPDQAQADVLGGGGDHVAGVVQARVADGLIGDGQAEHPGDVDGRAAQLGVDVRRDVARQPRQDLEDAVGGFPEIGCGPDCGRRLLLGDDRVEVGDRIGDGLLHGDDAPQGSGGGFGGGVAGAHVGSLFVNGRGWWTRVRTKTWPAPSPAIKRLEGGRVRAMGAGCSAVLPGRC